MVSSFVFSNRRSKKRHMAECPDLDQIRIFRKKREQKHSCAQNMSDCQTNIYSSMRLYVI